MFEKLKREVKEIQKLTGMDNDQPQVTVQVQFVEPGTHKITPGPRFVVGGRRESNEEEQ